MTREEMLNECVSRDKAIVQLNHLKSDWDDDWNVVIRKCIETIKNLPSVTPQPKMGEWIKNAEEWQNVDPPYICSECGRASLRQENFCCSCGADMRGDAE